MAVNAEIDEIVTLKSVDVFHLSFNRNESEYEVSSAISAQKLRVFREIIDPKVDPLQRDLSQRLALIKCKDWFYPLEREKTKVHRFRDQTLAYLFPDVAHPESVSIVVINKELVDEIKVSLFENVLLLYCDLLEAPQEWKAIIDQLLVAPSAPTHPQTEEPMETSEPTGRSAPSVGPSARQTGMAETIAQNIVYGAEVLSNGLTYGTQVANGFIHRGADQLRASQSTQPIQNREVDPRVVTGLRGLRKASHTACTVTGYAVDTVAKGTNQLGRCLAPHVRRQSKKLISSVSGKTDNDSEKICDDIFTVTSGALHGLSTLYNGIAQNAVSLAKTISHETVDVVKGRYGPQASAATEDVLYTAGNSAVAVVNVEQLGPKAIVKRSAFETGKTVGNKDNEDSTESQRKA